jgi:hypothetical protein
MTSKHTPGPYAVYPSTRLSIAVGAPNAGNIRLADVTTGCDGRSYEECKATADLMAAAPQLADALRAIAAERCGRLDFTLMPAERQSCTDIGAPDLCHPCNARAALAAAGLEAS